MSLFFILILLSVGFIFLLKGNLIPYEPDSRVNYKMGDLKELKAVGNFSIDVLQYNGESEVQVKSNESVIGIYAVEGKGAGKVEIMEKDSMPRSEGGVVSIKMKECNKFYIGGNVDLSVSNPLKGKELDFILNDNAASNISLDMDTLNLSVLSNANIKLSGTVKHLNILCKDNGNINASELEALSANVTILNKSSVRLNVKNKITGEITPSGTLSFKNKPTDIDIKGLE